MFRRSLLAAAAAAAIGLAGAASAQAQGQGQTVTFHATMSGQQESPPTNSKGTGQATAQLNTTTHHLSYDATWKGLESPATAAHFHGPAGVGQNAGVAVPIGGAHPKSPAKGTATLTPEQQEQLMSGKWYVNVHTKEHPAGAIRGQMERGK
jgi:hypothetical protein